MFLVRKKSSTLEPQILPYLYRDLDPHPYLQNYISREKDKNHR